MKKAIFLLLPITSLLYMPTFLEEFEFPKSMAFIAFSCFAALFVKWRKVLTDEIASPLLLVTVSAAASTAMSIDRHVSLFGNIKCPAGLLVYVSYLVLYLAAVSVFEQRKSVEQLFDLLTATSIAVAGYAIIQVTGHDFMTWHGAPESYGYVRPVSFLGHPNFMAEYLSMTLPLFLWRIQTNWRRIYKAFYGLVALLSGAAIFFSQSRGMWLATIAGLAVYFALSKPRMTQIVKAGVAIVAVSACCLIASPRIRETASYRVPRIVVLEPGRQEYLKAAIRIWERNPWFGVGTDAYELGFQHQRTPHYWQIEASGSPHKAHNDFLNTLATQGLFGALAAILLTVAVVYRCRRTSSEYAAPLTAAIAAFYVGGLSSFTVIAVGCLFVVFLAILGAGENENGL